MFIFVSEPAVAIEILKPGNDQMPSEMSPTLFNQLPQPYTKKTAVLEEDDEFLHKKETADVVKPKAKISVPSLSDVSNFAEVFITGELVVYEI